MIYDIESIVFHLFCPVKCLEENRNSYMVTVNKALYKV